MDHQESRLILSMDFNWKFYQGDISFQAGKSHTDVYNAAKTGGEVGPAQVDWPHKDWERIQLPHDWVAYNPYEQGERPNHGYKKRGTGWYRKTFKLGEEHKGKQIQIEFDGIATESTIYFNGSVAGRNFSAYNSFIIDVSDLAFFGDAINTLAVKVTTDYFEGWWYEGAGIYRHVRLVIKNPLHIATGGVWVNPEKQDQCAWNTKVETTIENSLDNAADFNLQTVITDSKGEIVEQSSYSSVCQGFSEVKVLQGIKINNPMLWDVDQPNLYKLVSSVFSGNTLVDKTETRFGFRHLKFCPKDGFYLNNKSLKLKGTCNHQDHAGVGVAVPDSILEYRIRRLKEMGCNAYRCAHNNPAPELLDFCDRYGMLVIDENRSFQTSADVIRQVKTMVIKDRNHPCVIMYSIFNEEPHQATPQGRAMIKRLLHIIKKLDKTRPVTGALNGGIMEDEGTADMLEVTGINYQLDMLDEFHEKYPEQPVVSSESVSAFSTRGIYETDRLLQQISCYDEEIAPWGATIRDTWKAVSIRPFVMGMFTWTGFDYRGEPTPFTWPSASSFFGTMDLCGFPKDAYYLHQACWLEEPVIHIVGHWNWEGREGKVIKIMSHTNCDEAELFLNGFSLGRKATPLFIQAVWHVPYEPGELKMKGYKGGSLAAEAVVSTAQKPYRLVLQPDRSRIRGDGADAVPINVLTEDSKGVLHPTADHKVYFCIAGDGRIIGTGNGDPNCHEPDKSDKRSLFNGKCQVIVQSLPMAVEAIILTATAEKLESAQCRIEVESAETDLTVTDIDEMLISGWRMTSSLFTNKPDPFIKISESDMNSWEPVDVHNGPQKKFSKKTNKYALYRSRIVSGNIEKSESMMLVFLGLLGYVEVYLNDELAAREFFSEESRLEIPLKCNLEKDVCLTVLIRNTSSESSNAGICKPVFIRQGEKL